MLFLPPNQQRQGTSLIITLLKIYNRICQWKKFWNSVKIWWNCHHQFGVFLFWNTVYAGWAADARWLLFRVCWMQWLLRPRRMPSLPQLWLVPCGAQRYSRCLLLYLNSYMAEKGRLSSPTVRKLFQRGHLNLATSSFIQIFCRLVGRFRKCSCSEWQTELNLSLRAPKYYVCYETLYLIMICVWFKMSAAIFAFFTKPLRLFAFCVGPFDFFANII